MPRVKDLYAELIEVIGEVGLVGLAEAFGGTRLAIPHRIPEGHDIAVAVGVAAAARLVSRFAPDVIRVPLARELRAEHYRAKGMTNAQIAVRLGMTEPGINRLFKRLNATPPA